MRIAQLTSSLSRLGGGVFESVRHLSKTLHGSGRATITVVGLKDTHTVEDSAEWWPVPVRVFETIGPSQFGFSPGLRRYLASANLDLIHVHGLWNYLSVAVRSWSRTANRPYVVSPRGMLEPWALSQSPIRKKIALWSFQRTVL